MNGSVELIQKTSSRINRKTGEEIIGQLKVAAYCRVSSDKEDQINSYKSQKKYYTQKISENVEWIFVDIYADEAITGTIDYKRSDFIRMINDAVSGKIDLIITKSVSRFARNTLDTLKYVRLLKQHNVAILFEEETGETAEYDKETPLTFTVTKLDADLYEVSGSLVDKIMASTNFADNESVRFFQRALRSKGIIDALREKGAGEGDTVKMLDFEFDFID